MTEMTSHKSQSLPKLSCSRLIVYIDPAQTHTHLNVLWGSCIRVYSKFSFPVFLFSLRLTEKSESRANPLERPLALSTNHFSVDRHSHAKIH